MIDTIDLICTFAKVGGYGNEMSTDIKLIPLQFQRHLVQLTGPLVGTVPGRLGISTVLFALNLK
jgi:hypothetical protein